MAIIASSIAYKNKNAHGTEGNGKLVRKKRAESWMKGSKPTRPVFFVLSMVLYDWHQARVLLLTNKKSPFGAEGDEKARFPQGREG